MAKYDADKISAVEGIAAELSRCITIMDDLATRIFAGSTSGNSDLSQPFKVSDKDFCKNNVGADGETINTKITGYTSVIKNNHPNW